MDRPRRRDLLKHGGYLHAPREIKLADRGEAFGPRLPDLAS